METLHVEALIVFALLLFAAATLELVGTWRFTTYLRNLVKRQPPNTPNS